MENNDEKRLKRFIKETKQLKSHMANTRVLMMKLKEDSPYYVTKEDREKFLRFLEGASDGARRWADELDKIKEEFDLENLRE